MLSFMRDQDAGRSQGSSPTGVEQPTVNPPGKEDGQEYLTVAANKSSLRKSTILVAILVTIGLVCLGFMIRKSRPQSAMAQPSKSAETEMEATISRLTGISSEMLSRMDQIGKKFCEFSDVFQVGVNELAKNPFEVEKFASAVVEEQPVAPPDDTAKIRQLRQQRLKEQAAALKLLSVMRSGQESVCMINDQLLRCGQSISGFTVTKIGNDSVQLTGPVDEQTAPGQEADVLTVELKLAQ